MIYPDLGSFVIGAGLVQSLLLAFFFFNSNRRGKRSALLGWAFLLLSILFLTAFVFQSGIIFQFPHISRLGFPLGASAAPLFSVALRRYFGYPKDHRIWEWIFFAVPVLMFSYSIPYFLLSAEEKLAYIFQERVQPHPECTALGLITLLTNVAVFVRIYYRLGILSEEFSKAAFIEIVLFRRFVFICIVLLVASVLLFAVLPGIRSETLSHAALSLWVIGFAWFRVYAENSEEVMAIAQDSEKVKYRKSLLSEEAISEIGERIFQILNQEEFYLDPESDLGSLSAKLGLSVHAVSQTIGRYFGKSFLELCRELRIEKAKRLLLETDHPVLRVGLDAGFNSKTSFLRAFKEETGMTPTSFRAKQS
ncbi:AraC family transcriptional regulator [Leptospira gomenensis]|uniref:AraC family transcriptional regulator n=1 Tax=Leptospira gomenensis TaxID=2484974 RepID=A0A5F1YYP8_9LEPT|nr:helix-turn-helix domain-containing protein [Leptospira gomenensis]TGK29476.1 AraC family transcriptional regulator [Leptospira gomenensis]TGK33621.1 AraC family transcriptional regulator [Leptospira gomenensis]TGK44862.1 AraC family transcriptional regulator [Leptospira gomenensis]TGK64483.1 AraC family transcriptional regulator [Leptospira gomenensis]